MKSHGIFAGAALALVLAQGAVAQDVRGREELVPVRPEARTAPAIATSLPELKPVRKPLSPRPGRAVLDGAAQAPDDAELARIDEARTVMLDAVRAARRVGDVAAVTESMRRLELLRQERLDRMRRLAAPRLKKPAAAERPAAPGIDAPVAPPVLEMPTAPKRDAGGR